MSTATRSRFTHAVKDWEEIERQIERLGFGENYAVSRGKPDPARCQKHTRVTPLRMSAQA